MKIEEKLKLIANEIVRIRDKNKPCIICGNNLILPVCCHYFKQSKSQLTSWDIRNIHLGDQLCNGYEENTTKLHLNHKKNLIYREGQETYNKLEYLANSCIKLSKSEKEEKYQEYKVILKELRASK